MSVVIFTVSSVISSPRRALEQGLRKLLSFCSVLHQAGYARHE